MSEGVRILASEAEPEPREDVARALLEAAEAEGLAAEVAGPGTEPPGSASIALALDAGALARAPAGAFRVAVLPAFDTRWRDPAADAVFVAHEAILSRLDAPARRRAHVVGPIAPPGFVRAETDDDELEGPVVLILPSAVMALGPTPLLVQLSLVSAAATYLFDVGRDAELAEALRTFGRGHVGEASRLGLFASEEQGRLFARAELVIGTGEDVALAAALGAGAGLVVLEPGAAREALEASGCAILAKGGSMLSVALDEALADAGALREHARALAAGEGAARAIALARELASGSRETPRPEGLPRGIEWLPGEGDRSAPAQSAPEGAAPLEAPQAGATSLEDRIEAELAALKESLD